jgi:hypothetical protein
LPTRGFVAQADRAAGFYPAGWGFEPSRTRLDSETRSSGEKSGSYPDLARQFESVRVCRRTDKAGVANGLENRRRVDPV